MHTSGPTPQPRQPRVSTDHDVDLATLKRLLQALSDDWRMVVDQPRLWLLFDGDGDGRHGEAYIDIVRGEVVTLSGDDLV